MLRRPRLSSVTSRRNRTNINHISGGDVAPPSDKLSRSPALIMLAGSRPQPQPVGLAPDVTPRPSAAGTIATDATIRAILCGCDPGATLGGSVERDLENMSSYLVNRCGAAPFDVQILVNDGSKLNTRKFPFGARVGKSSDWKKVVADTRAKCKKNDVFIFYLSGHGMQAVDDSGDEIDGRDEYVEIERGIHVRDDEFRRALVSDPVAAGMPPVKMILLSDTCHSGTMFDLPYLFKVDTYVSQLIGQKLTSREEAKCCAVSISASADAELAYCDVGEEVGFGGALTIRLIENDALFDMIHSGKMSSPLRYVVERLASAGQRCLVCTTHTDLVAFRNDEQKTWVERFA